MKGADRLAVRVAASGMPWTAVLVAVALAEAGLGLAVPAVLGWATDRVLGPDSHTTALVVVAAVVAALTLLETGGAYLEARARTKAMRWTRSRFLEHVFRLDAQAQRRYAPGDLVNRFANQTNQVSTSVTSIMQLATALITAVGGAIALFLVDPWLGLLFAASLPVVGWLGRRFANDQTETGTVYVRHHGEIATRLLDAMRGIRTIRSSGTVEKEIDRILAPVDDLRSTALVLWRQQVRIGLQTSMMQPVLQVGVLAVGGYAVVSGRLGPGQLLAASGYLVLALGLLRTIPMLTEAGLARSSATLVHELLESPTLPSGGATLHPGPATVRLRGIRVTLDGSPLLDDLDLDLPAGSTVALVGRSGAGKTTLATVVGGLLLPDRGTVTIDGTPLPDLRVDELRQAVAYAYERPHLLGETVRDALTYGSRDVSADRLDAALEATSCADFVGRLPDRLETRVDDLRLSGGEVQRLGLARTACRRPKLVVLDDALSSVDTATEASITRSLLDPAGGTTRLLIAHRPSTAGRADLVAWLDAGRIRAMAPHHELCDDPDYRSLFVESDPDPEAQAGVPAGAGDGG